MSYSINDADTNMTLFYTKSNGDIKGFSTGIQSMTHFGVDEADYTKIWNFIVLPMDEYVLNNWQNFTINLNTLVLELKPTIPANTYPVATS